MESSTIATPPPQVRETSAFAREVALAWAEVLGLKQVREHDNFFELGGDSLLAVRLLLKLEQLSGRELPVTCLYHYPTLGQLTQALDTGAPTEPPGSLVIIQEGESTKPLFWVPGAMASDKVLLAHAPYISRLARELDPARTVYSVYQEYPASSAAPTVEEMAAEVLSSVRRRQASGPYYLAGWSFGGLVAYEMARQLVEEGEEIALLAVFDTTAPGFPRRRPWAERMPLIRKWWSAQLAGAKLTRPLARLGKHLFESLRWQWRRKWSRFLGSRGPWERVMRLEDAYMRKPGSYRGHVAIFVSEATLALTADSFSEVHDPALGWEAVSGSVETHVIAGDHHTMFDDPGMGEITRVLQARMAG